MKFHFYVRFYTTVGQSLSIIGNIKELGENNLYNALTMTFINHEFWQISIETDISKLSKLSYKYILTYADGHKVIEHGEDKSIDIKKLNTNEIQLVDTWNYTGEYENIFYTSAFQNTLFKKIARTKQKKVKKYTHYFKVKAPLLQNHEVVCLYGSDLALGDWNTENPILLYKNEAWWTVQLSIPREAFPLQYKYGIYNTKEKINIKVEDGENRLLFANNDNAITILHDGFLHVPNNTWKAAGVAIPVFSLRSNESLGIGEFNDLKLLVDWSKKTGIKLIQILPVNDTTATHTFTDSYPYAAISAFALHPIYINIKSTAGKKDNNILKSVKNKQKELNSLPEVNYKEVLTCKLNALKELYLNQKEDFLQDDEYKKFFENNKSWLVPYAVFCYLRDKHDTCNYTTWKMHAVYNKLAIEKYAFSTTRHYDNIAIHYFIQYHLHLQLKEVIDYAHKNGVIIKGDVPIGIYRYSCDAWMNSNLYNIHLQAGAPPDDFAIKGQNWGFPTYNWQNMQADGFAWWKQRFNEMSKYFDAFRIDHILGFFRIWSIPIDAVEGIMGYFVPALPIQIQEFTEKNIWFSYDRYTKPFITDHILYEIFNNDAAYVKEEYLQITNEQLELKEIYNTQRKVENYFKNIEENPHHLHIKLGLFNLISNVIFFEQEGSNGTQFHFRIAMQGTSSFKNLEWNTQQQLKDLYVNYFFYRQDEFWMKEAMLKLPVLKAYTNMLVCGEDLGMVPHSVPVVMKQLGILSLEIQRMPKDINKQFFHPNDAPYLSVVTPSTHDMSTIRGWWEEDREKIQAFFNNELGQWGSAPFFCEAWINRAIINQHLHSPAMWSIFQLQDILGMSEKLRRENPHDERINIPANPKHYWQYRMHINLEQLIKEKEFNHDVKEHIEASGR